MIFRSTPAALRVKSVVGESSLGQFTSSPEFPAALRVKSVVGEPSLGRIALIPNFFKKRFDKEAKRCYIRNIVKTNPSRKN